MTRAFPIGLALLGAGVCLYVAFISSKKSQPLEMYFQSMPYHVEHNELFAGAMLQDPSTKEETMRAIVHYLRGGTDAPTTRFHEVQIGKSLVRARDYWAVLLSDMMGSHCTLYVYESASQREAKIEAVLGQARALGLLASPGSF